MPSWNDLGAAFSTLRELDVNAIRDESERPVTIVCLGEGPLLDQVTGLLRNGGGHRHGAVGLDPLLPMPLVSPTRSAEAEDDLRRADMLMILLDGRAPIATAAATALGRLADLALPTVIVIGYTSTPPIPAGETRRSFALAQIVALPNPNAPEAADNLADALLQRLPGELHLAAARSLPGVRPAYARQLINATAFTNASYALASALPEQIPIFNIPFAAADILVLTKNQAMLVYRLALGHGAPPDFQARVREVLPVVGGAFAWRQVARTLIGLVPVWGVVPKVAIAYAGTYSTGVAAWRWFADGEIVSSARLKEITKEALRIGRERAVSLVAGARERGVESQSFLGRLGDRLRNALPGAKGRAARKATPRVLPAADNDQSATS